MEQKYKRVENLDTKIKEISLPYIEWKVLFLTAEDTSQDELGELIKENNEEIAAALKSLEEKGLVELAESAAEEESLEEEVSPEEQLELEPETQEVAAPEFSEQVEEKESETQEVASPELSEQEEEKESETQEVALPELSEQEEEKESETQEVALPELSEQEEEKESETQEVASPELSQQEEEKEAEMDFPEAEKSLQEDTLDVASEIKEESEDLEGVSELDEESLSPQEEEEIEATELSKKAEANELLRELDTSIDSQEKVEQNLESMIPETETQEEEETEVEAAEEEVAKESEEEEPPASEEFISDVSKQSILVIDDSIVIRKMIEIALEEEEYRIITATSGKDGMEIIEKEKPNLIILDMILPDMNGIEVLKKIKMEHKSPVIMLSGKDAPQLVESAKEVGVEDFLPKPFRDEELVEKIKNLLE